MSETPQSIVKFLKRVERKYHRVLGAYRGDLVNAYWFTKRVNFGDLITPLLLRHYGLRPMYTTMKQADVVCVGSLLNALPESYVGYIAGCGLIQPGSRHFPNAEIWGVRGRLTLEYLGASEDTILGDPGLLVDQFVKPRRHKPYSLGIVPHFVDKTDPRIASIQARYPKDITVIDVQQAPQRVIAQIAACQYILSSSLHGIITADSLGIPNAWVLLSDEVIGNGFKFHDYASAFDQKIEPVDIDGRESLTRLTGFCHAVSPEVQRVKQDLNDMYIRLKNHIIERNANNRARLGRNGQPGA